MSSPIPGIPFTKMEGCGNDYVFVDVGLTPDGVSGEELGDPAALSLRVSDRHTGIGSDGLILVDAGGVAPVRMRMWNADGSEGRLCLNGLRCVARFAGERVPGLGSRFPVDTAAGHRNVVLEADGEVTIEAGAPDFRAASVAVRDGGDGPWMDRVRIEGIELAAYAVSVGNPHLVLVADAPTRLRTIPVDALAPLAVDPRFPEGINVHLVAVADDGVQVLHWERGSGPTRACGSGAVAVYAVMQQLGEVGEAVRVHMPGGTVRVVSTPDGLRLTGPANVTFHGFWNNAPRRS